MREAEQNRAPHIRLGQEIANRTRLYFNDYLEDLSADMPGVELWKEPFSTKSIIVGVRKKIVSTWMRT